MTLREQLMRDEGLRLWPYRDTNSRLTIGFGRNLDDTGISSIEAGMLLDHDIASATSKVLARLPWASQLDEARRGVLINMCFNMGSGRLMGFKNMLAAMQRGDWDTAARELLDSAYSRQVGARSERLAAQLRDGQWH